MAIARGAFRRGGAWCGAREHGCALSCPRTTAISSRWPRTTRPEPHWYLPLIGVDPAHQGEGHGDALMAYALARCDRDHAPAYLESSKPRNIPFYRRYGFETARRDPGRFVADARPDAAARRVELQSIGRRVARPLPEVPFPVVCGTIRDDFEATAASARRVFPACAASFLLPGR